MMESTDQISLIGMNYFACTVCGEDLDQQNAFYFFYCHHVYCTKCMDHGDSCPCHTNGVAVKFSDYPKFLLRFRILRALQKNIDDINLDLDETVEDVEMEPLNSFEVEKTSVDIEPSRQFHLGAVIECQLENLYKREKDAFESSRRHISFLEKVVLKGMI